MAQRVPTCYACGKKGHTEGECPQHEQKKLNWQKQVEADAKASEGGSVYIGNLDARMSKGHVKKLTAKYGVAKDMFLENGICHAKFANLLEAEAVVTGLNGKVCLGKKLEVSLEPIKQGVEASIAKVEENLSRLKRGEAALNEGPVVKPAAPCYPDIKLKVFVKCRSKTERIYDCSVKEEPYQVFVEVRGVPRHGEANDQVCKMVSKVLSVKLSDVEITRGFTSEEDKHITVKNKGGMSKDQVAKKLTSATSK
eukprot:m.74702 g.74702  ORF g.74702 m.74702 type:complete len:253 (+) comp24691_c0_seq1:324-1082(+)